MRVFLTILSLSLSLVVTPISCNVGAVFAAEVAQEFAGPSQRFLLATPFRKIKPVLKSYGMTESQMALARQLSAQEELGFFGYHGARREFLIFQDIIRNGLEEILDIPIRSDFHFMRIPGDPFLNVNSTKQFFALHPKGINDNLPRERLQLLAMNLCLYSLYQEQWELSLHYFSKNTNVSRHDYEQVLIPFFIMLGVDPAYISHAFTIGESWLSRQSGVLMQFFDHSNYEFLDQHAYLAIKKGARYYPHYAISEMLMNLNQRKFPQFRLLLSNQFTLNPHCPLSIYRYTLTSDADFKSYQDELKRYFQSMPFDQSQKELYKAQLLSLWGKEG